MPTNSPLSPSFWPAPRTLSTVMRPCCALRQFPPWHGLVGLLEQPLLTTPVWRQTGNEEFRDDTPPPQVGPHRACHRLGRLARRRRQLSGSQHRRPDQPGCRGGSRRVSLDEPDRTLYHHPAESRRACDRTCPVLGHRMGFGPVLLGPSEISAHDRFHPPVVAAPIHGGGGGGEARVRRCGRKDRKSTRLN